jgi:hypothetical protein
MHLGYLGKAEMRQEYEESELSLAFKWKPA